MTSRTDPLTRAETYTYDANGNLTSVTDRKSQTTRRRPGKRAITTDDEPTYAVESS